jgi:hypothetical protein
VDHQTLRTAWKRLPLPNALQTSRTSHLIINKTFSPQSPPLGWDTREELGVLNLKMSKKTLGEKATNSLKNDL